MSKIVIACAVFAYDSGNLKILLTKDDIITTSKWEILSSKLQNANRVDDAVLVLLNEYGAEKKLLVRQLKTFVDCESEVAESVITISYYALININDYKINFNALNSYTRWWNVNELTDLTFSHNKILDFALYQLSHSIRESRVGFDLLPENFSLSDITNLYQDIFGLEIDDESIFCKKIVDKKIVVPLQETEKNSFQDSNKLYKFNPSAYEKQVKKELLNWCFI